MAEKLLPGGAGMFRSGLQKWERREKDQETRKWRAMGKDGELRGGTIMERNTPLAPSLYI